MKYLSEILFLEFFISNVAYFLFIGLNYLFMFVLLFKTYDNWTSQKKYTQIIYTNWDIFAYNILRALSLSLSLMSASNIFIPSLVKNNTEIHWKQTNYPQVDLIQSNLNTKTKKKSSNFTCNKISNRSFITVECRSVDKNSWFSKARCIVSNT